MPSLSTVNIPFPFIYSYSRVFHAWYVLAIPGLRSDVYRNVASQLRQGPQDLLHYNALNPMLPMRRGPRSLFLTDFIVKDLLIFNSL